MESDGARQHPRIEIQVEKREKAAERVVEEIMTEKNSNGMKDINLPIQECHQTPVRISSEIHTKTHYN